MRNIFGFATAFAAALILVGIVRASVISNEAAPPPMSENQGEDAQPPAQPEKKSNDSGEKQPAEKPVEKPGAVTDLGNEADPVTGENVGDATLVIEHKSWRIKFAGETGKKKFERNPIRYYARLSLEPTQDGKLFKTDASKYEKATAEKCPIMGSDIDPDGDVFILHRGFKVYFCCWSGCADEFMQNPAKHYAHYGLEEKDGKLARK